MMQERFHWKIENVKSDGDTVCDLLHYLSKLSFVTSTYRGEPKKGEVEHDGAKYWAAVA